MKIRLAVILMALVALTILLWAQKQGQGILFRSPVDYTITLSGAFGEIRRNHFHSGIDIRTGGVQGKPVYAIADGYVSRVNISPSGFGKAIYINHPNGYTSLYAHLRNFPGAIGSWIRSQQYKKESFAIDTEVPEGTLRVKKGDLIAYSGNSGSSAGPHIHFEIRDTKTQEVIDPLDFGFMKSDGIPPKITWVKIYPHGVNARVNFSDKALLLPVTGSGGKYRLKLPDTVKVSGNIIFGIETSDHAEGGLKTGVHAIELSLDGEKVFAQDVERFAFAQTRYVNSVIDYPAFVQNGRKIQRSYVAPNNKLDVYAGVKNNGVIHFSGNRMHRISYLVRDAFGNRATLEFYVKSHPPVPGGARPGRESNQGLPRFTYASDNRYEQPGMKFNVPAEAVYEDFLFECHSTPSVPNTYASVYQLHNKYTPLHTWCTLSIRPENLPANLTGKALIVAVSGKNTLSAKGGTWENGWITTKIRDFGNYSVAVDTQPPVIKAVNIFPGKKVSKQSSILVRISDNLAGIKSYRGTLNGKWILMDYDEKKHLLAYTFDEMIRPGKNRFELVVTDGVGNTNRYTADLIR